jgi:5'(3')-deoxyribonucleotidase
VIRKRTIGVDMDNTTFELVNPLLIIYNSIYDENVRIENIKEYNIHQYLRHCHNIFDQFITDDLISKLELMEGAKKTLSYLNKYYDIFFVTAGHPSTILARDELLSKHFVWYQSNRLIRLENKSYIRFDYLIDDCVDNFYGFKGTGILYTQPWNEDFNNIQIKRADNWYDVSGIIMDTENKTDRCL